MSKKFFVKTLGCKTNQIEEQIIAKNLKECGFEQVFRDISADIFILNSCTVTSHSVSSAHYLINQIKRKKPEIKVILTGCWAQTLKQNSEIEPQNVDLILGNNEKLEIEKYINELFCENSFPIEKVGDIFEIEKFNHKTVENTKQTRPSIKIQEGCNNRCAYCLIPFARGKSRSNSVENVIEQINSLAKNGTKEVVLTGIHIGQWGAEWGLELCDLLFEIEKSAIERYRLGSLYINELTPKMLDFLTKSEKFCPHFHLSLQSLCDKTLSAMNRKYSANEALEKIEKLYSSFDEPFLGCDIIAGFPNESDEDFLCTYENLKKAKLSEIHAFPYSKRKGTLAYDMENQIPDNVKKERMDLLLALSGVKHGEFLERNKNKELEFLFEKKSPKTGEYSAISRNYIKVYIKDERDDLRNTLKTINTAEFEQMY